MPEKMFAAASESPDDPERCLHPVARLARPRAPRRGRLPRVRRGERHGGGRQAQGTGERFLWSKMVDVIFFPGWVVQPTIARVRGAVEGSISPPCRSRLVSAQSVPLTPPPTVRPSAWGEFWTITVRSRKSKVRFGTRAITLSPCLPTCTVSVNRKFVNRWFGDKSNVCRCVV